MLINAKRVIRPFANESRLQKITHERWYAGKPKSIELCFGFRVPPPTHSIEEGERASLTGSWTIAFKRWDQYLPKTEKTRSGQWSQRTRWRRNRWVDSLLGLLFVCEDGSSTIAEFTLRRSIPGVSPAREESPSGEANPEGASSFVTHFYIARSSSLTEPIAQGTHERRVVWPVNRSWSDFTKWHQLVYLFFSPTTSPNYHRPDIGDVLGLGIMGLLYVCVVSDWRISFVRLAKEWTLIIIVKQSSGWPDPYRLFHYNKWISHGDGPFSRLLHGQSC